jgi:hypothetical protein
MQPQGSPHGNNGREDHSHTATGPPHGRQQGQPHGKQGQPHNGGKGGQGEGGATGQSGVTLVCLV